MSDAVFLATVILFAVLGSEILVLSLQWACFKKLQQLLLSTASGGRIRRLWLWRWRHQHHAILWHASLLWRWHFQLLHCHGEQLAARSLQLVLLDFANFLLTFMCHSMHISHAYVMT